jgi:Isochorismatase family
LVAIVGIATEVGIEPTARHAADLGFIPVIITDACGAGDQAAAQRSLESLRFAPNVSWARNRLAAAGHILDVIVQAAVQEFYRASSRLCSKASRLSGSARHAMRPSPR